MALSGGTNARRAALAFALKSTPIFLAIGGTAAWTDDTNPPAWDSTLSALPTVIAYMQAVDTRAVYPDGSGVISVNGVTYTEAADIASAVTHDAHFLYVRAVTDATLPTGITMRQAGLYAGLVRAGGVSTSLVVLLPGQVTTPGALMAGENFAATVRSPALHEIFEFIVEIG